MTISKERLANAYKAAYEDENLVLLSYGRDIVKLTLEADDIFTGRATAPSCADSEPPKLPEGVKLIDEGGTDISYQRITDPAFGGYIAINIQWSADDLEAIAKHIRWRSRPKPAAKGEEVTEKMLEAAWLAFSADGRACWRDALNDAIQAALAAGKQSNNNKENT